MEKKYWLNGSKPWMLSTRVKDKRGYPRLYEVIRACHIGIVRHIKIRGNANPFDPEYFEYFRKRRFNKTYGQRARLAESFV
jgi:RNA-directed DNA polymerase